MMKLGFSPSHLVPPPLDALLPHERTELLLLAREAGMAPAVIAGQIGVSCGAVETVMAARHRYRLNVEAAEPRGGSRAGVPAHAATLLLFVAAEGGRLQRPMLDVERATGIPIGYARDVARQLERLGCLQHAAAGAGRRSALWEMTEAGAALAARIADEEPDEEESA